MAVFFSPGSPEWESQKSQELMVQRVKDASLVGIKFQIRSAGCIISEKDAPDSVPADYSRNVVLWPGSAALLSVHNLHHLSLPGASIFDFLAHNYRLLQCDL